MNATKKREMYERINRHGAQLLAIFPDATEKNPVALCKKLRRLETEGENYAVAYCNGSITGEQWEERQERLLNRVNKLLGNDSAPVFVNGDPRGYALKTEDDPGGDLHRDWGGYGILAPDCDGTA